MAEPDPLVVQIMREYRAALLAKEANQIQDMTRRWLQIEGALEINIAVLLDAIAGLKADGLTVDLERLVYLDRYQMLMAQVEAQIGGYTDWANGLITGEQLDYATTGLQAAVEALAGSFTMWGQVTASFNVLPVDAVVAMAGFASDGSPLALLLAQAYPEAAAALTEALIRATALGMNPRDTALEMMKGMAGGLNRLLLIARTEQLRAYREATRLQYGESGLVKQYRRLSARDLRVCAACLFADGWVYPVTTPFEEHPNGRCSGVPIVEGLPMVTWKFGQEWFMGLNEPTQRDILGNGRWEAWKAGKFTLDDVVGTRKNATWGNSLQPTPLKELIG